jgi:tRNA threonylcarbamoyladenosine biosynthesis protein TsaB
LILALDATGPRAGIALLNATGETLFRRFAETRAGLIETLPLLLAEAIAIAAPKAIAVTIGPGSFTGLRTAIALAQGYAAAAGIPLLGVTTAEAYAQAFPGLHRPLWVAIRARKNRIFVLRGATAEAVADADLPRTRTAVAAAGDAANELAAHLAASGGDVLLTNARTIDPTNLRPAPVP